MAEPLLRIQNVSRVFPDGTAALNSVSFLLLPGEFAVICGRNGSGKSVLMSLIAGLDEPTSGTICAPDAGLVFQNADAQILGETPEEDILFSLRAMKMEKKLRAEKAEAALKQCGLLEKRRAQARLLSGGEKRRLAVAGILAMERELIIFDEPFANLDYPGVRQVCAILQELKAQRKTVIVLTHELEKILGIADRFIVLDKGSITFDGTPQDGLAHNLEQWGIRNPLGSYRAAAELFWGSV
ncbi:MAG: energy-coupling factor ABC transporter ATP-binding protein [Treponemataceae bacterium]|nr:energy-coupling factor ABC transporter ATP-binding protein [Treponemataceae bacterium]